MRLTQLFLASFILFVGGVKSLAAEAEHILLTPYELEIQNKSKKRLYPGGVDEEPLKIQAQLPTPNRGDIPELTEVDNQEPVEHD